jgi:(E)-2-((N-methylformamido)methylene)succinate hydrolase
MSEPTLVTPGGTPVWVTGTGGPTVVLIHGVLMDHRMWNHQVAALSSRCRVCCLDMLGHGLTPDQPGDRTLDDFVAQAREVIELFSDHGKPILGGFSMGGLITQAYAARYHESLAGIMILNAVYDRSPDQAVIVRERSADMLAGGAEAAVASGNARWFTDEDHAERPELVAEILSWISDGDFASKVKAHRVFSSSDDQVAGRLGQLSCPALIMTGDGDAGSTPAMAYKMFDEIPNAELHVLKQQRHMMPVLDAVRVNEIVASFVNGL